MSQSPAEPHIQVRDLSLAFDRELILTNLNFEIKQGDIFIIMGGSGSGKSTLMKALIGLKEPRTGTILYQGLDFWQSESWKRERLLRRVGVLYQGGALWSSMTLAENVALPLEQFYSLARTRVPELVSLKLSLVGLAGFEEYYPAEISGGMRKRAGLARAIALDPDILFFDEPSAGLDPVSAKHLDDLILEIKKGLGTTIVVVSHELASIFAIGTNSVFLDAESKTVLASGNPEEMLHTTKEPKVQAFLTRGGTIED
ncbi:MAG: ATP-binding cassette domain-containing protein [Desulfohalobiaceae bacterium]|nr:ATP-binding cassette domain-containing protein [Desulfohalobiaceae bacterium]